jgi:hypothetical protein
MEKFLSVISVQENSIVALNLKIKKFKEINLEMDMEVKKEHGLFAVRWWAATYAHADIPNQHMRTIFKKQSSWGSARVLQFP